MSHSTVRAYRFAERPNTLMLAWSEDVNIIDIRPAFQELMGFLKEADTPQWVIVDISHNRSMPVAPTISQAIVAYRHKMLREWLVVGENSLARSVSQVLVKLTQRNNVHWFESIAAALTHIDAASKEETNDQHND